MDLETVQKGSRDRGQRSDILMQSDTLRPSICRLDERNQEASRELPFTASRISEKTLCAQFNLFRLHPHRHYAHSQEHPHRFCSHLRLHARQLLQQKSCRKSSLVRAQVKESSGQTCSMVWSQEKLGKDTGSSTFDRPGSHRRGEPLRKTQARLDRHHVQLGK
jgi:hypothetical protein